MCWFKRHLRNIGIVSASALLLLICLALAPLSTAHAQGGTPGAATPTITTAQATPTTAIVQPTPTEDATVTALNKEKLVHENDWWWNNEATIISTALSSLISSLVIATGIFLGYRQWSVSRKDTQKKESQDRQYAQAKEFMDRKVEREQRAEEQQRWLWNQADERTRRAEEQQRWLKNQEAEREKREEERFQSAVEQLGSEREEARANAAILLLTFLQPGYERFHTQIFDLSVAHLRFPRDFGQEALYRPLVSLFKASLPLARNQGKGDLDATDIKLANADLRNVDLRGAILDRANLWGAQLNEADLSGAHLREVDLSGANLSGANLSGVQHIESVFSLEQTDLRGVQGLTKEQKTFYKSKGAKVDEDAPFSPSPSAATPPSTPQSNGAQTPSVPSVQNSTPPGTDEDKVATPQQEPEP